MFPRRTYIDSILPKRYDDTRYTLLVIVHWIWCTNIKAIIGTQCNITSMFNMYDILGKQASKRAFS